MIWPESFTFGGAVVFWGCLLKEIMNQIQASGYRLWRMRAWWFAVHLPRGARLRYLKNWAGVDGLLHVDDLVASCYGGQQRFVIWPYLARVIVAGDNDSVWSYLGGCSFDFCIEGIMVSPDFKEIADERMFTSDVV